MDNALIIIFGATGDLTKRKLIPALYHVMKHKKIEKFAIVGAAIDTAQPTAILANAREFIDDESIDETIWNRFEQSFYYQQLDFAKQDDFNRLHTLIEKVEKKHTLSGNRIVYFAAAAQFFCMLTEHCVAAGIAQKSDATKSPWHRVVYEKPFGNDVQSAHEINECIAYLLNENQIYRIDHYLTKEVVSNIALIRFANCVFEPLWNNRYVDQVQINLSEKVVVGDRGGYYDNYGELADVVQNHILELLALVGMEAPDMLSGDYVREQRARVLQKVEVVDGLLGQYNSYTSEHGVKKNSKTETFAALMLRVNNPRWAGVPFYIKSGKALNKKEIIIHIKFKQVDCLLAKNCPSDSNWLTIKVTPDATFVLNLNAKKPGFANELVQVGMEYCHSCLFGQRAAQGYEVLFEEIIRGEQASSVRFDEIEYAWKIIESVRAKHFPLHQYECGSTGPEQALAEFARKHGMRWRS